MGTPILRGSSDVKLQKQVFSWDATRGGDYSEIWQALDPSKAAAFYNGKVYTTRSAQMTITNGTAELELKWGAAADGGGPGAPNGIEVTTDRWECPQPTAQKPVFEHPQFLAYLNDLLAAQGLASTDEIVAEAIANWRKAAAAGQKFAEFQPAWDTFLVSNPAAAGYMARCYRLVTNDQTHYQASLYSLRHTTNAPNYWSLNRADVDVNRIYTPAQFMAEVTDGSLWYFPLPGRLQFKLAAAVSNLIATIPARTNYLIGWLKDASAETSIHGGRIEIQTEYKLDQWSTDLYAAAT
jgi:hypothetical protein